MGSWYHTTPETPQESVRNNRLAATQDSAILDWLVRSGQEMTAWGLQGVFPDYQITSIRRSLFTLEKEGSIIQTGFITGPHRVKVGKFKAVFKEPKQAELF